MSLESKSTTISESLDWARAGLPALEHGVETYPLLNIDRHIVVSFPEGLGLIDTGSSCSIGLKSSLTLVKNNWPIIEAITPPTRAVFELMHRHLDPKITFLIGNDLLCNFVLLIDDGARQLAFMPRSTQIDGEKVALENELGLPLINITFPRADKLIQAEAVFDTGAWMSYGPLDVVQGFHLSDPVVDFLPGIGAFETPTYLGSFTVGKTLFEGRFGVLPDKASSLLRGFGVEWVIGRDIYANRSVALDLANKTLTLVENPPCINPQALLAHYC